MRLRDKVVLVTGVSGTAGDKIAKKCLSEERRSKGLSEIRTRSRYVKSSALHPSLET